MEVLEIKTKVQRIGNVVYVEYHPANLGIENVCYHGQDLPIVGTIAETVEAYMPIARQAILEVINEAFEGGYE